MSITVSTDNLIIDHVLINDYLDNLGSTIVKKMLNMYEVQSKIYLEEIEQTLAIDDQKLWHERCHKMKGAAGSVGMKKVHAHLVNIEKSTEPTSDKTQLVDELKALNEEAIKAFSTLVSA